MSSSGLSQTAQRVIDALMTADSGADGRLDAVETHVTTSGGFVHSSETKAADGALSPVVTISLLDSSGATCQTTLANASAVGTVKYVICKARTNTCDVDATMVSSAGSASTFTFSAAGGLITLIWTGAAWQIMGYAGGSLS